MFFKKKQNPTQLNITPLGNKSIRAELSRSSTYQYQVFTLNGQLLSSNTFRGTFVDIQFPVAGLFLISVYDEDQLFTEKVFVE